MKKLASSMIVICIAVMFAGLAFAGNHAERVKGPFTAAPK
jgi:hypothetical protein